MKKLADNAFDGGAGISRASALHDPYTGKSFGLVDVLNSVDADRTLAQAQALTASDWSGTINVGGKTLRWVAASLANDSTSQLAIRPTALGLADPGRFEVFGTTTIVGDPVTAATANGTVMFTVPAGFTLLITPRCWWSNSIAWTGGTAAAIGAASSASAYSTAGDLQGGAGGDLTAAMGTGYRAGSAIGTKLASGGLVILTGGDTVIFNKLVSTYTAGAGVLNIGARRI
jgi:hypothetical protein